MNQIQQGDVICRRVKSMPTSTQGVAARNGRFILAEGEATGHAHAIDLSSLLDGDISLREDKDGTLYLSTTVACTVTHEEHKPVTLSPGIWEIGQVVEVDPFEGEVRTVTD